jgi:hypothetical protein
MLLQSESTGCLTLEWNSASRWSMCTKLRHHACTEHKKSTIMNIWCVYHFDLKRVLVYHLDIQRRTQNDMLHYKLVDIEHGCSLRKALTTCIALFWNSSVVAGSQEWKGTMCPAMAPKRLFSHRIISSTTHWLTLSEGAA